MEYATLLALHLIAVVIWVGGLLVNGAVLGGKPEPGTIATLRRWNLRLVAPAMILVWALGITLAVQGGWFVAGWLHAKLLFVLLLSALHGMQTGTLRRMVANPAKKPSAFLRYSAHLTVLFAVVIVFLVTSKPF